MKQSLQLYSKRVALFSVLLVLSHIPLRQIEDHYLLSNPSNVQSSPPNENTPLRSSVSSVQNVIDTRPFDYDPIRKEILTTEPARVVINLGYYRVGRDGKYANNVFMSNFDKTQKVVANTVCNRVFDAYLREIIGDPNISVTDIYGVENLVRFYNAIRGNIFHGRIALDELGWKKEGDRSFLIINGHKIEVHQGVPTTESLQASRTEYLIDFSDTDLTRETEAMRQQRLEDLLKGGSGVKKVFAFFPEEDPPTEVVAAGINAVHMLRDNHQYFPLASPVSLATMHVLMVLRTHFEGEFDTFGGIQASRPLTGDSGNMQIVSEKKFGEALRSLLPDFSPRTTGSLIQMVEYDAPKGSVGIRILLNPKSNSKFVKEIQQAGKQQKEMLEKLRDEVNKAFKIAAEGALKEYLRYADKAGKRENLNSLLGIRDSQVVVLDSQKTAVLESGQVELHFNVNDVGYANALNILIKDALVRDGEVASASDTEIFTSGTEQGHWRDGTIPPNRRVKVQKIVKEGEEIGYIIVGARGRIGKMLKSLFIENPNYLPKAWLGVKDIDTLIQQSKEDVVHGPDPYEIEKSEEHERRVCLRDRSTGEYLTNPKTGKRLTIPYFHIEKRAYEDDDIFERRFRQELGTLLDETEVVINASGFALDKHDPYYNVFQNGGKLRIIMTAAAKGAVDITVLRGVNEGQLIALIEENLSKKESLFISAASCTTQALGRALTELIEYLKRYGVVIKYIRFLTEHSMTPSQGDLYGSSSAGKSLGTASDPKMSSVLEETGANKAVVLVQPKLKGQLSGISRRTANYSGAVVSVNVLIQSDEAYPTEKQINEYFKKRAEAPELQGILSYAPGIQSTAQIIDDLTTSIFIPDLTKVEVGKESALVTVAFGYDNEAGYAAVVAHIEKLAGLASRGLLNPESVISASTRSLEVESNL